MCTAEPHEEGTGNSNELRWTADGQNVPPRRLRVFESGSALHPKTVVIVLGDVRIVVHVLAPVLLPAVVVVVVVAAGVVGVVGVVVVVVVVLVLVVVVVVAAVVVALVVAAIVAAAAGRSSRTA